MNEYPQRSVVRIRGLKSKPEWNEGLAQIFGSLSKQRYPVVMLSTREKALIKPSNFYAHRATAMSTVSTEAIRDHNETSTTTMDLILNDSDMIRLIVSFIADWDDIYKCGSLKIEEIGDICGDLSALLCISSQWRDVIQSYVTRIDVGGCNSKVRTEQFLQEHLNYIARAFPRIESLTIELSNYDEGKQIDFTLVRFAELNWLALNTVGLRCVHFDRQNTPKLKFLTISKPLSSAEYFYLDLDHLDNLNMDEVGFEDASDFANSLSRCPKLECVTANRIWGLSFRGLTRGAAEAVEHIIISARLSIFELTQSDCTKLMIWAPNLTRLNLNHHHQLHVRLMDNLPRKYMKDNDMYVDYARVGNDVALEQQKKIEVNLINAGLDTSSRQHLENHSRFKEAEQDGFFDFW